MPSAGPRELLSAVIPDFVYLLDGWRPPDPSLYKGTPTGRLARFMLNHGRAPNLEQLLLSWKPEVRAMVEEGDGIESRHPVVSFFYCMGKVACGGDVEEARRWLLEAAGDEEDDMGSTGFEGVKAFYREQGLKEGRQEGRAEGYRALLCELLEERFGPIREDTHARIATADVAVLKKWSRRLVHVDSLGEVFDD